MATSTRQVIREYMLDQYGLGRRGTNTGASASAITDDVRFGGSRGSDRIENGCEVYISSGGAAPEDETTRLNSKFVKNTGVATLDPALTAALADDDTFEILYLPFRFKEVHDSITNALTQKLWERRERPVSLVTSGGLFADGDWTESGATDTVTAPTFPWGLDEMHVENSGANGYTASVSIPVEAGKPYFLEATVRVLASPATNTATLVLYDLTNSAAITLNNSTSTQQEPTIIQNGAVTMPDGCELVEIRIGGSEADFDGYWSNVNFHKNNASKFTLQDRIEADRIGRVFYRTGDDWQNRGESNRYYIGHTVHMLGNGLWQIQLNGTVGGHSLWYEEFTKGTAMTADTDTTGLPAEHVAAAATVHLLRGYADDKRWGPELLKAMTDWAGYMGQYDEMRAHVDRGVRDFVQPRV